jgi:hypothetical protein
VRKAALVPDLGCPLRTDQVQHAGMPPGVRFAPGWHVPPRVDTVRHAAWARRSWVLEKPAAGYVVLESRAARRAGRLIARPLGRPAGRLLHMVRGAGSADKPAIMAAEDVRSRRLSDPGVPQCWQRGCGGGCAWLPAWRAWLGPAYWASVRSSRHWRYPRTTARVHAQGALHRPPIACRPLTALLPGLPSSLAVAG